MIGLMIHLLLRMGDTKYFITYGENKLRNLDGLLQICPNIKNQDVRRSN